MIRLPGLRSVLLATLAFACHAHAATLTYPLTSEGVDSRYDYDWAVLRAALERTSPAFGAFEQRQSSAAMSPSRVLQEMTTPSGRINIFVRASSPELETHFLPIRLPVDRGLLGYRLLLIRQADRARLSKCAEIIVIYSEQKRMPSKAHAATQCEHC